MKQKCKSLGCPGEVEVNIDDKVIGNFRMVSRQDAPILVTVIAPLPENTTVESLPVVQPDHAEIKKQVVLFQRRSGEKLAHTDRFFLTCNNIPAHTLPYEITIEDERD